MLSKKEFKEALDFVKLVGKKDGSPLETHCRIHNGYVVASNGVLTAGHTLATDASEHWCPPTYKTSTAVNSIRQTYDLTHHDNGHVTIKSGPRSRMLECVHPASIPFYQPDGKHVQVPGELVECFKALTPLIGSGEELLSTTLLLKPETAIVTDKILLMEYYHGVPLPGQVALTKPFLQLANKIKKPLTHIGVGERQGQRSVTFWFEDDSWIMTQLYAEDWMDLSGFLASLDTSNCRETPKELPDALTFLMDDLKDEIGTVILDAESVRTAKDGLSGSRVALPTGCASLAGVSAARLATAIGYATAIDFNQPSRVVFTGEKVRGAIAKNAV